MTPSDEPPLRSLPLMRSLLVGVAVVAAVVAFVPVERLAAALSLGDGQSSGVVIRAISRAAPGIAAGAVLIAGLATLLAKRTRAGIAWLVRGLEADWTSSDPWSTREAWRWLGVVVAIVLLFDGPTLVWGFFETDDYDLFRVFREVGLWGSLLRTHNDHVIPLLRLETAVMQTLFGSAAEAYNVLYLASFAMLLWSGCLWLRAVGVSRWSCGLALLLCSGWTLWGQFTSGAYILQKYMQIAACGGFVLWGWQRWRTTGGWRPAIVVWSGLAVSTLLNVSGFWVPCALVVAMVCDRIWPAVEPSVSHPGGPRRGFSVGCCLIVAAAVTTYLVAYSLPGNQRLFSLAETRPTVASLACQTLYYVGTLVLSVFVPTPHHLAKLHGLWPAMGAGLLVAGVVWTVGFRGLPQSQRGALVTATLTVFGIGLMVCLGRPAHGFSFIWGVKYLGPGYFWLCLALGLLSDGWLRRILFEWRGVVLEMLVVIIAVSWTMHGLVNAAAAAGVPFFQVDVTRWGQLREHARERRAIERLRRELFEPLEQLGGEPLVLPDVPGSALCRVFPELTYSWGEQPALSVFTDVLLREPRRVKWVDQREEPDPRVQTVLDRNPLWQELSR